MSETEQVKALKHALSECLGMCQMCGEPCDLERGIIPEWCAHPAELLLPLRRDAKEKR